MSMLIPAFPLKEEMTAIRIYNIYMQASLRPHHLPIVEDNMSFTRPIININRKDNVYVVVSIRVYYPNYYGRSL